jgi:HK97 family phage major capsid protein
LEGELSAEVSRRTGRTAKGFFVPTRVLATRAILTPTTGAGALKTAVSSDYIDLLRAQSVVAKLGAQYIGGLVGDFSIPRQTAGSAGYWIDGTSGTITIGSPALDQVTFRAKYVGALTDLSRGFLSQTSLDAEQFVRNDLTGNLAVAVDTAALNGTGTSNQPLGIRNNTNCNFVSLSVASATTSADVRSKGTGSAMTWAKAIDMETKVAAANVIIDSGAYLFTPSGKGALKLTPKQSGYPEYLVEDDIMNGYPVHTSNVIPLANGTNNTSSTGIFGNWRDLVIGQWGALDILVDPYTLGQSGAVRMVAIQDTDMQVRHPESFTNVFDLAY